MGRAIAAHQAQTDGALRPQIGHIEDHACAFEPAEQDPRQAEKQRRTLDHQVVRCVEGNAPTSGCRDHEREIVRQTPWEVGLLGGPNEAAKHGDAVALLSPEQAAIPTVYPARGIIGHRGEHGDLVSPAHEFARHCRKA